MAVPRGMCVYLRTRSGLGIVRMSVRSETLHPPDVGRDCKALRL